MRACPRCSFSDATAAAFCSQCGWKLSAPYVKRHVTPKLLGLVVTLGVGLWGALWFGQPYLIGTPPTETAGAPAVRDEGDMDPRLASLRDAAMRSSDDINALKAYADGLWEAAAKSNQPSSAEVLELIDVLSAILRQSPDEERALLMMANVSFNQRVFDKAAYYFERYLKLQADDYESRASYASVLTFLGRHDDALRELDVVDRANPKYFQGLAYRAITLSQMGKNAEARKVGEVALALSPSDEARARFVGFLDSIDKGTVDAPQAKSSAPDSPVTAFIKGHAIAGSKFVSATEEKGILVLSFRAFPMHAMPEGVRKGFLAKIKDAMKVTSLTRVRLVDADSREELASVDR